jgi:hypothetical protein
MAGVAAGWCRAAGAGLGRYWVAGPRAPLAGRPGPGRRWPAGPARPGSGKVSPMFLVQSSFWFVMLT